MNYLDGRKYSSARWANDGAVVKKECMPLDLALKEAQSKGSILERITSLEQRLIQVNSLLEVLLYSQPRKVSFLAFV